MKGPPSIELLPEHLIDQIKAGEVIERPGNLLKEILENSVDAGATKIEILVKNNGLDLISLKDNGHGMRKDDLPYAFSRHATSKISRFEDLYQLSSYGFRGEALASIAAIAKVQCVSMTKDEGSEIRIEGGRTVLHEARKSSGLSGTELVIQDLFFNTPARLKFIQGQQSEKQFVKKVIYSFVVSHPEVEFQVKFDDEEKEIYAVSPSHEERLRELFPRAKALLRRAQRSYEQNELELFLVPASLRGPMKVQYIFINGRMILDKQLHRVVTSAIQALSPEEDFHYLALLDVPPDSIDVNVHPSKTTIKFLQSSKVISLLSATVKDLFVREKARPSETESSPQFFAQEETTLLQERHEYNMDGHFSPHRLEKTGLEEFQWVGSFLVIRREGKSYAVSPTSVLREFCEASLQKTWNSIPLLVSEPFSLSGLKQDRIQELRASGLEFEVLAKDTLVLRSIPEWMNGFPLREIVDVLLRGTAFSALKVEPHEWASSTWEEMIDSLTLPRLLQDRIALDLETLLRENLR